jgi:hypothetical protein
MTLSVAKNTASVLDEQMSTEYPQNDAEKGFSKYLKKNMPQDLSVHKDPTSMGCPGIKTRSLQREVGG